MSDFGKATITVLMLCAGVLIGATGGLHDPVGPCPDPAVAGVVSCHNR